MDDLYVKHMMQKTGKSTKVELVQELEYYLQTNFIPGERNRVKTIIEKCKQGHYHDFESPFPFPKMNLVRDLEMAGLTEIADKVKNGEYDE